MFDSLKSTYNNIISEIGIVGYLEEDIIKRGFDTDTNLPLNLLYSFPNKESSDMGNLIFQMMFPDDDHKIQTPKFFSLTLTNEQASRSFLYCLKFPEKYSFINEDEENKEKEEEENKNEKIDNDNEGGETKEKEKIKYIDVPLVIYIKSVKEDLEPFKQLLYSINQIIVNDNLEKQGYESNYVNNYKKVQLMNLLYFLFVLPHTSPHSLIKLQLNKELENIINLNPGNNNETIDFYFSSNCEIPCNKNDTDINILFLILDQSIIIKVLFSILTEKQIIFTASQAYLLHSIISTFLKLIFPFKWHHSCITVVPKENLDVLEIPSSYIFGVLSNTFSTKELIEEYPGKIIVDCDTNEIFGYSNLEAYEPPEAKIDEEKKNDGDKKKKDKDKKKELVISNLNTENFAQGKNLIIINKNTILKYDGEIHGKKQKLTFDNDNNIIIDTQQSKLFIDKNDIFIDSSDWKWLRRNIQLVRNPEIFNLDNIDINNKKIRKKNLFNDEDNPILPNRSFSYNIQNIILTFILKKLTYTESDFFTVFKKTNLYLEYQDTSKEFENTKGKKIVKNIEETKNEPRSIDNSFIIEYILNPFNVQIIIDKLDGKINNNEKEEELVSILKKIKKPFVDYYRMKEELLNNNNEGDTFNYLSARKPSFSEYRKTGGSIIKNKVTKNLFGHVKNNTSLLQETSGQNKYVLLGIDKDVKDTFQFYTKKGFIYFLIEFEKFLKDENLNIKKIIYNDIINSQILYLINKCFNKQENKENKEDEKEKEKEENNDLGDLDKKNLRKALGVSIVPEKKEEENVENELGDRDSQGSVKIKKEEEDFDFAENLIKGIKKQNIVIPKIPGIYENLGINDENNIISFPSFDFDKIKKENRIKNKNENGVNLLMQYYLFLAYYLQEAKKEESSLKFFLDNISIKNFNYNKSKKNINIYKNNESDEENEEPKKEEPDKININQLILKLHKLAYKCSGKKHRDFPYYSFYNYIYNIESNELKTFSDIFDLFDEEDELGEIYRKVIIEKQQIELKKLQKMEMMQFRNNTSGNIARTSTNYKTGSGNNMIKDINNNNNDNYDMNLRKSNIDQVKNKIGSSKIINFISLLHKRQSIQIGKSSFDVSNENINSNIDDFNINYSYVINSTSDFNSPNDNNISISIINEIGDLLTKDFPTENDLYDKTLIDILEETHTRVKENKNLIKLVGQLKYIKYDIINTKAKCLSFWLNCFNYLILFVIFYRKWNINGEKKWKKFFRNVKFDIGGKYFSFNDMEYIIFKKPSFFSSTYKAPEEIRKLNLDRISGDKKLDECAKLVPFLLFLPVKKFLSPSLYDDLNIEKQIIQRMNKYINKFIYFDDKKHLCCSELLLKYDANVFGKGLKKYETFFKPEVYKNIKDKKYKKINSQKISWNFTLDYLIENCKKINNDNDENNE